MGCCRAEDGIRRSTDMELDLWKLLHPQGNSSDCEMHLQMPCSLEYKGEIHLPLDFMWTGLQSAYSVQYLCCMLGTGPKGLILQGTECPQLQLQSVLRAMLRIQP